MTTTTPPTAPPTATAEDDELEDCEDAESSRGAVGVLIAVDIQGACAVVELLGVDAVLEYGVDGAITTGLAGTVAFELQKKRHVVIKLMSA